MHVRFFQAELFLLLSICKTTTTTTKSLMAHVLYFVFTDYTNTTFCLGNLPLWFTFSFSFLEGPCTEVNRWAGDNWTEHAGDPLDRRLPRSDPRHWVILLGAVTETEMEANLASTCEHKWPSNGGRKTARVNCYTLQWNYYSVSHLMKITTTLVLRRSTIISCSQ